MVENNAVCSVTIRERLRFSIKLCELTLSTNKQRRRKFQSGIMTLRSLNISGIKILSTQPFGPERYDTPGNQPEPFG